MDLLNTYDSGSDSERDESQISGPLPIAPTIFATSKPTVVRSILRNKVTATATSKALSKKGKKLLKLNAVLPKEILERLQRNDEADDSSDDDDDLSKFTTLQKSVDPPQKHTIKGSSDVGIISLLQDLHSFIPSESTAAKVKAPGERIGRDLMNISSTIITKQQPGKVVDIHASNNANSKQLQGEDVTSESEEEAEAAVTVEDQKKENDHIDDNTTTSLPTATQDTRKPIVMRRTMNAAPQISSANQSDESSIKIPIPAFQAPPNDLPKNASTSNYNLKPSSSKSKREIEKALRQGNFESIESLTSHTIDTREYSCPDEKTLLATSGMAVEGSSSFRTSGLERYVPSEGMTSQGGVAGKMKGKSQIHSLVSTAAAYESNQRRMAAMGMNQSKSGRADAKRKYGW